MTETDLRHHWEGLEKVLLSEFHTRSAGVSCEAFKGLATDTYAYLMSKVGEVPKEKLLGIAVRVFHWRAARHRRWRERYAGFVSQPKPLPGILPKERIAAQTRLRDGLGQLPPGQRLLIRLVHFTPRHLFLQEIRKRFREVQPFGGRVGLELVAESYLQAIETLGASVSDREAGVPSEGDADLGLILLGETMPRAQRDKVLADSGRCRRLGSAADVQLDLDLLAADSCLPVTFESLADYDYGQLELDSVPASLLRKLLAGNPVLTSVPQLVHPAEVDFLIGFIKEALIPNWEKFVRRCPQLASEDLSAQLWEKLGKSASGARLLRAGLFGYAWTMLRNLAWDVLRKRSLKPLLDGELGGSDPDPAIDEADEIEKIEARKAEVKACVQKLPDEQRRIIDLRYFGNVTTYAELAEALSISITRAFNIHREALEGLERCLRRQQHPPGRYEP